MLGSFSIIDSALGICLYGQNWIPCWILCGSLSLSSYLRSYNPSLSVCCIHYLYSLQIWSLFLFLYIAFYLVFFWALFILASILFNKLFWVAIIIIIIIKFIIIYYSLEFFHFSISWWSFTGDWVTASLLKSPGLFSVFWPFSIMLLFGLSPLGRQLLNLPGPLIILKLPCQKH